MSIENTSTIVTGGIAFNSSSTVISGMYHYSDPVEMDRYYTDDGLTIVYKREKTSLINPSYFTSLYSEIEVYKEVHTFGPMGHKIEYVQGVYTPPQQESYEFPEEA